MIGEQVAVPLPVHGPSLLQMLGQRAGRGRETLRPERRDEVALHAGHPHLIGLSDSTSPRDTMSTASASSSNGSAGDPGSSRPTSSTVGRSLAHRAGSVSASNPMAALACGLPAGASTTSMPQGRRVACSPRSTTSTA